MMKVKSTYLSRRFSRKRWREDFLAIGKSTRETKKRKKEKNLKYLKINK